MVRWIYAYIKRYINVFLKILRGIMKAVILLFGKMVMIAIYTKKYVNGSKRWVLEAL